MSRSNLLKKLGLGTAQWGLNYGLSNQAGQTSSEEVFLILDEARRNGIRLLDTASLYGNAETVLGKNSLENFDVVTKTPSLMHVPSIDKSNQLVKFFQQSLENLSLDKVSGLLIHNADDIIGTHGVELIGTMKELQSKGLVEKLGVSFYEGSQIDSVLHKFTPDIVQIPLNVLDKRLIQSGHLNKLKELGIEVHVRSVFLQGLLLTPPSDIHAYFKPIKSLLRNWHNLVAEQDLTPVQAALIYVRDLPEVDKVLVGTESTLQLIQCMNNFSIDKVFSPENLDCRDSSYLNPSSWELT